MAASPSAPRNRAPAGMACARTQAVGGTTARPDVGAPAADGVTSPPGARVPPVVVLYTLAVTIGVLLAWRGVWRGDTGLHLAVIEQVRHHPLAPPDPLTGTATRSPYYSPLVLVQGLASGGLGVSARTVLRVTAAVNLVLLASGVHHLVARLSRVAWAPVLAFLGVLLLHGSLVWSGFLGLNSLVVTAAYPAVFAVAVTLHLLALAVGAGRGPHRWWRYLVIGVLAADVALDHQFTALGAALGVVAVLASRRRPPVVPAVAGWCLSAALATTLALSWPYFSLLDLIGGSAALDPIHHALYRHLATRYGLALAVGVPALVVRARRDHRDPLVLLAALAALVAAFGAISGHYAFGRTIPIALLAGHLAAGVELARLAARHRRVGRAAVAATVVAGLVAQLTAVSWYVPVFGETKRDWGTYSWTRLAPGTPVLTDSYRGSRMLIAYRVYPAAPAYPEPWLDAAARRRTDSRAMLSPTTPPARRAALLRRYRVHWLITAPARARRLGAAGLRLTRTATDPGSPDTLYRIGGGRR